MASSAPYSPLGHAPLRRPRSIRRTTSLQASWPQGRYGPVRMEGAARDLLTLDDGRAVVVAEDHLHVMLDAERTIRSISANREIAALQALVGRPSIGGLRGAIAEALHDEATTGTPLYTLIEDIPGVSLVCNFAWTRWPETRAAEMREEETTRSHMHSVCAGFAPGSSALTEPPAAASRKHRVPTLVHPDDPPGWHELPPGRGMDHCRYRRIDAWIEGDLIRVDSMFQDSAAAPDNTREAAHEYALQATIDARSETLIAVDAQPHILPYRECPGAIGNLQRVVGTPLNELRRTVLGALRRTDGCTHLNDATRAMAEIPQLLRALRDASDLSSRQPE